MSDMYHSINVHTSQSHALKKTTNKPKGIFDIQSECKTV